MSPSEKAMLALIAAYEALTARDMDGHTEAYVQGCDCYCCHLRSQIAEQVFNLTGKTIAQLERLVTH